MDKFGLEYSSLENQLCNNHPTIQYGLNDYGLYVIDENLIPLELRASHDHLTDWNDVLTNVMGFLTTNPIQFIDISALSDPSIYTNSHYVGVITNFTNLEMGMAIGLIAFIASCCLGFNIPLSIEVGHPE